MLTVMKNVRSQNRQAEIAARVRAARLASGLSQEGLGQLITPKVSGATISTWENGKAGLDVPTLEELGRVLDQPLQFFTGQAAPRRDTEAEALGRAVMRLVQEQVNVRPQGWRPGGGGSRRFPIINTVPASDATVRDSQLEDEIDIPDAFWLGAGDPQVYRVTGDCMTGARIFSGNTVIIDAANTDPRDGQIVIAQLNGGLTLKCFYRVPGGVELRPDAPGYESIFVKRSDDLTICGVLHKVYDGGDR